MDDLEAVKERIRKLLALADNNPNIHEAATAAAHAQRLMERYRIDKIAYDLDQGGGEGEDEYDFGEIKSGHQPLETSGRLSTWKTMLASAIAKSNGCRIYISHSRFGRKTTKSIIMVGRDIDMGAVRVMYDYLLKEIDRLCKRYLSAQDYNKSEGRVAGNNFRLGAVEVIDDRLTDARKKERDKMRKEAVKKEREKLQTNALALHTKAIAALENLEKAVDAWMEDNLTLKAGRSSSYRGDRSAYAAGRRAARSINLDKGKTNGD